MRDAAAPALQASVNAHPLERFRDGRESPQDLQAMRSAIQAWYRAGGKVPLEQCLRLPRTTRQHETTQRNEWLNKAAALLLTSCSTRHQLTQTLSAEWNAFLLGNLWRGWRDDGEPPPGVAPINEALFHASRLNRGQSLTAKQLSNVLGNFLSLKFPTA